jgi:sugar lactone lactonase YvrE
VLRIGADGKPVRWFQTEEKYVLALAVAPDGVVYAATGGGKGRIYRITADGKGTIVHDGNESHITALAMGGDGTLYAGTAPNGIVLKAAGPGVTRATVLYDANEPAISGLGVDKAGNVFAATAGGSGRGLVYKIAVDGASVRVAHDKSPGAIAGLQVAPDGTVWFASGATVYALAPDGGNGANLRRRLRHPDPVAPARPGRKAVGLDRQRRRGVRARRRGGGGPRSAGAPRPRRRRSRGP